jgi:hypothetical protein
MPTIKGWSTSKGKISETVISTRDTCLKACNMGMARLRGHMARNIKGDGNKESNMERESGGLSIVVFTKETGRMGRNTGKEDMNTLMETDTKEST